MIRVASPLPPELESRISDVINCALIVHRTLGPGFVERIYRNAVCLQLQYGGIAFEYEKSVVVQYRGRPVGVHRLDLLIENAILVELKAVAALESVHCAQVLSCMKAANLRVGLLVNFGGPTLKAGLRRFVI